MVMCSWYVLGSGLLVVLNSVANAFYMGLYGFADTTNYNIVAQVVSVQSIERATRYVGLANQIGACTGSFAAFFLVSYYFEGQAAGVFITT